MVEPGAGDADAARRWAEANRLIAYHSPISLELTAQRTSYASQLIPVTAYILVGCSEAFLRYPDMVRRIDAALPAPQIVDAGRHPGTEINSVHLWSVANFWLTGRKVMATMDPSLDDPEAAYAVLDFWERAALAYRGDGTRQAWDDGTCRPFGPDVVEALLAGTVPVADAEHRQALKRLNATLVNHLFLIWFDTRSGIADTGPYELGDGRVLLVREFTKLSRSDFWWSEVAAAVPYPNLTAALVLDGVEMRATDFGSSTTSPEDYLDHLVGFGLFTTTATGELVPVDLAGIDELVATVRRVQAAHYRAIASMSRDEMIRCGAYVYFSFLRPFAEVAGMADELDWSVPRDVPGPLVELLSAVNGEDVPFDPDAEYYLPLAERPTAP